MVKRFPASQITISEILRMTSMTLRDQRFFLLDEKIGEQGLIFFSAINIQQGKFRCDPMYWTVVVTIHLQPHAAQTQK